MYIEPPAIVFSDVGNPDDLRPPDLTHGQVAATAALVSAVLEAPKDLTAHGEQSSAPTPALSLGIV